MAFASGKYAIAICDRCGFQYKYLTLKKEWTGFRVCPECYEPKHPQLDPPYSKPDPAALQNPRPDRLEPMTVFVGGAGFFEYNNSMQKSTKDSPVVGLTVGNVTVSIS